MAFTSTSEVSVFGNKKVAFGTYTNTSTTTGGVIVTGLDSIAYFNSNCETSQAATVNLAARSSGSVTLTTVASEDGTWFAIGN